MTNAVFGAPFAQLRWGVQATTVAPRSWMGLDMLDGGLAEVGKSSFISAPDGLRLHVREYGTRTAQKLAVVCLPGLTRTVADFDTLAPALAKAGPRRVLAVDLRGRGQSEYDRNPENYNLLVELGDVAAILTALAVGPAVFVGSSRGGLLSMQLAVAHPTAIAGVVLHDIGPVIEPKGLARLRSYVGKLPQPRNFAEGAEILRSVFHGQFPNLTPEQWRAGAERTWRQGRNGSLTPTYDVNLSRTLNAIDIETPLPPLWNEFDALARVPMMLVHGGRSDILSAATVAAMAERHTGMEIIEIPDQGHVPLLDTSEIIQRVTDFVARCDETVR